MKEKQQEKSLIKQNILLYLAYTGVSAYEFYKVSGVTRGILQQNNGISEDNIARFLAYAPNINTEWLLTGKGDMVKGNPNDAPTPSKEGHASQAETAHQVPKGSQDGIPLIPLSAMAGAFTGESSVMEYECERYVIPAFKGADFLIQIKGDSMQPTYVSGDLVACQRMPLNDLFFQWNKIYVLDTIQGALIKRIMPGSDADHVLIVSDNNNYPPFELHRSQFNGVALVCGIVRLE